MRQRVGHLRERGARRGGERRRELRVVQQVCLDDREGERLLGQRQTRDLRLEALGVEAHAARLVAREAAARVLEHVQREVDLFQIEVGG